MQIIQALILSCFFKHGYAGKEETTSLAGFDAFKIRFRGDGRTYFFQIHVDHGFHQYEMFNYPLHTRGGPLWEELTVSSNINQNIFTPQ